MMMRNKQLVRMVFARRILFSFLCVILFSLGAWAQTNEVVKRINQEGFWMPYSQWLESRDAAEGYIRQITYFTDSSLQRTQAMLDRDHERAMEVLKARDEIIGKTKSRKKQDKKLAKYFSNVDKARQVFAKAEETEDLYKMLSGVIDGTKSGRQSRKMPSGNLVCFSHHWSNGFAGIREEITLQKKDGKFMLTVDKRNMIHHPEDMNKEAVAVEVPETVARHVRDIIEEGKLYEIGSRYMPDIQIMDASNWSLYMKFEGGSIDSSGYAEGPDHSDVLGEILRYLNETYQELSSDAPSS